MKIIKIFLFIFGFVALAIVAYLAVFGRALSQNENHARILFALPQATAGKAVAIGDGKYFSKNSEPFINEMKNQGFEFTEQMGAGYFFTKGGKSYLSIGRMYSSHFMVFNVPVKK